MRHGELSNRKDASEGPLTDNGISDHPAQLSSRLESIQRYSNSLENQSIVDIGFDLRVTRTPWPADVVLCPCPLNGQGSELKFAITRKQRDIASAIHLRNVWDLSLVKFA